jgi:glycerophosphoryl diester phosphodiesterase
MNRPPTVAEMARSAWHDFRRARRRLFVFAVVFTLFEAWLLVPAIAVGLSAVLSRAGHVGVSNRDVVDYLLTPPGLLYAALMSTTAVALLLVEQAGIMALVAGVDSTGRRPLGQILSSAFRVVLRLGQLAAIAVALLALSIVPFILAAVLMYVILLSQHDINYYWTVRPPAFWIATGLGALLLVAALATTLWLYVRWAFALPLLLFENQFGRAALRASRERVRGVSWRVGIFLLGWVLGALLLGAALEAGFQLLAAALLANAGEQPTAMILLLLAAQGGLVAGLSYTLIVGHGLLARRLYLSRTEQLGLHRANGDETDPTTRKPASPWAIGLAQLSLTVALLVPWGLWADLRRHSSSLPLVRVTAHRGHSRVAPENTLRAIREAIASGADYAEVDVQQTADGVIVLLHDRDLKRVAGVPKGVGELTYGEVRNLDVGRWFGPTFAGERVPTLAEAIDLCRGRIRMNIDLKFYSPDRRLAPAVARLVRQKDFESDCLATTLEIDALREGKHDNPRLRTGLNVAYALGDVSRLDVEAISVRADFLSEELLRDAHRSGKEVHVWTVNEAREMDRLIQRGVDNIITDDPDLLIRVRDEWASRTEAERLVLASRLLLGLNP